MTTDEIKKFVANGETDLAIKKLFSVYKGTKLYDAVIQLSNSYENYVSYSQKGVRSSSELDLMLSQINERILSICQGVDESTISTSEHSKKSPILSRSSRRIIISLLVVACLIFLVSREATFKEGYSSITVLVSSVSGKGDLVLPNRGEVILIYGDAKIAKQIDNQGEVTFKQIPISFFDTESTVELLFIDPLGEPYKALNEDSLYVVSKGAYVHLLVKLANLESISGIVEDFSTNEPIDSVIIRVSGEETLSNEYGEFSLSLPLSKQKQFVTIRAYKKGYDNYNGFDVPVSSKGELIIPLKRSRNQQK